MDMAPNHHALSIGALSTAVGIPVGTLRTWERRYGYPVAIRRPSGHRRYPVEVVAKLTLVKRLIGRGHKPSELLPASEQALRARFEATQAEWAPVIALEVDDRFDPWFDSVYALDATTLQQGLQHTWWQVGAVTFLDLHLSPFLVELGMRWRTGRLGIGEEHFASQVVVSFLSERWRQRTAAAGSRVVVVAALPGEHHIIGLHMAATALSFEGWDVRFLGADSPPDSVARIARAAGASAVALGSSPAADTADVMVAIRTLRSALPSGVYIWLGGARRLPASLARPVPSMAALIEQARAIDASSRREKTGR